jgi:hypothetical protein
MSFVAVVGSSCRLFVVRLVVRACRHRCCRRRCCCCCCCSCCRCRRCCNKSELAAELGPRARCTPAGRPCYRAVEPAARGDQDAARQDSEQPNPSAGAHFSLATNSGGSNNNSATPIRAAEIISALAGERARARPIIRFRPADRAPGQIRPPAVLSGRPIDGRVATRIWRQGACTKAASRLPRLTSVSR